MGCTQHQNTQQPIMNAPQSRLTRLKVASSTVAVMSSDIISMRLEPRLSWHLARPNPT